MRKITSIFLLLTMVFLCACTSKKDEISLNKNAQQENNESIQKSLQINIDVISDTGLSYSQICAKRGKLTNAGTVGGGVFFEFENGFGRYAFPCDDYLSWKYDENGNVILSTIIPPSDDIPCLSQDRIKLEDLFPGISLPISISEIEQKYNVKCVLTEIDTLWPYIYCMIYNNTRIYFGTDNEGIFEKYNNLWTFKKYGSLNNYYFDTVYKNVELPISVADFEKQYNIECTVKEVSGCIGWKYVILFTETDGNTISIFTNNKEYIEKNHHFIYGDWS